MEKYEAARMDIVEFETEDIIMTSGAISIGGTTSDGSDIGYGGDTKPGESYDPW